MNVTLRQLQVFQAVAATSSFTRAGRQVGLTQPAVSRCVTELEHQLGLKLLNRTTREVVLTDAGKSLSGRLHGALDELQAALQDVSGMATQRRGRVRVASSPTLSAHLLPDCIALCKQENPALQLIVLDRLQQDALNSVVLGEVDFGVVVDPGEREDLRSETILSEPFCVVLHRSHRLARKRSVAWRQLAGEPLVLLDHASGSRRLIDRALAEQKVDAMVVQEVGHATTVFHMLEAGLGVSVLPELALRRHTSGELVHLPLTPRVDREIMLVVRRNRALVPLAQIAWDLVRRVARSRSGSAS
ncbi:putative DNA-binding transcriptional regulator [Burkholderiales bacterium 8X]|nr:putative DNA-binding transcriptional regulator [Burkholderiales bacterium 8X]